MKSLLAAVTVALLSVVSSPAAIWLPAIFGDHMVLQAEKPVKLWGKAKPGETVSIAIVSDAGAKISFGTANAGPDSKWSATLPPVPGGQNVSIRITAPESGEKVFTDVLTGEVWLLSGQSNMRWTVAKSRDAEREIAAANHPRIRLFVTELKAASEPMGNLKGEWKICSPESVGDFSGAGYFFGRELHEKLGVPVGMILSAVGGTPIQAWTPLDAMDANPATAHISTAHKAYFAQPPEKRRKARGTWIYGAQGEKAPARLYNGMVHPLIPLSLRGIAWCQGEANAKVQGDLWDGPDVYAIHFPLMIGAWRKAWDEAELPFLYIELANFMEPQKSPVDAEAPVNWASIREAQSAALALPHVSAISTIDIGEADDIHYKNKQEAGHRLALAALGEVYRKAEAPAVSPRYASHAIEKGKVRIRFSNAEGGLATDDGAPPRAFAVRGESGDWQWAEAAIEGEDILVWHPHIPEPAAIRHAWANNPDVNVTNRSGLPLSSFRTDADPAVQGKELVPLFNGKNLDGWHALPGGDWSVQDGQLVGKCSKDEPRHGLLVSDRRYKDFHIRVEFLSTLGNSGLYFRSEKVDHAFGLKGFQAEITPQGAPTGGLFETMGRKWVAHSDREQVSRVFKKNDWNTLEVIAIGGSIQVILNGAKVCEIKDDPGSPEGHLGLQLHGGQDLDVRFRKVEIKEITQE